jgi:hypothetical protein
LTHLAGAREQGPVPRRRSRDVASRDARWPPIIWLDSNRDFVVEFVAPRSS